MITVRHRGDLSKATNYLRRLKKASRVEILDRYGRKGVEALSSATPVDSGITAASWYYEIESSDTQASITFYNSHVNKGFPVAIMLQYGHGTGTGGWVQGRDYLNPVVQPLFDQIAEAAWKEVTKL